MNSSSNPSGQDGDGRLILVSNRLPISLTREDGELRTTLSAGGLATGLSGPHRESGGSWIGWPGIVAEDGELPEDVRAALAERGMRGVALSESEYERYYSHVSNQVIWPLFHYFMEKVHFSSKDWAGYVEVNRKFAEVVLEEAGEDDIVFVQDFHLMLVPGMLREARPKLRIGFFLHIPFPSSEIFRVFPPRAQVLRGLLGADVLVFHTLDYVRHFRTSVRRVLGVDARTSDIAYEGRRVCMMAQPLGIDAERWRRGSESPEVQAAVTALREAIGGRRVVLGVERLDYTKGIPERLRAFHDLLEADPSLVERVMMIQVAVPSRIDVEDYRELKDEVDRIAGGINSAFGRPGLQPLHYQFRSVPPEELMAMYHVAEVALVTPLRDGLNLVAKEYVASRVADDGVLVIGEFTGAAWELGEALHVNPFDPADMLEALRRALSMSHEEQTRRMAPMRRRIERGDVRVWARTCIEAIRRAQHHVAPPQLLAGEARKAAKRAWLEAGRRRLFLDYDGSLQEFTARPEDARPSEEVRELLTRLSAASSEVESWVVSGRSHETLEEWLGGTGVGLIAEHGVFVRRPGAREWEPMLRRSGPDWRPAVEEILAQFTERVPGSLIERKAVGLAWHYRASQPALSTWQARELYQHLDEVLSGQGLEVMRGDKVIEIRPAGVNKGSAILGLLGEADAQGFLFAAGDDTTDETTFQALPDHAWTVLVGGRSSAARYRLHDPPALRALLREWLELAERRAGARDPQPGRTIQP